MSKIRPRAWLALLLVGALSPVAVGGIVLMRGGAVSGSDTAIVRVGSDLSVPPGGSTTVAVEVSGAAEPGIGAVTVDIAYDAAVIRPSAWAAGSGWNSVLCNLQPTPNSVRCTAVNVTGTSGNLLLTSITFQAVGTPGQCSALEAQVVTFADPSGNPVPAITQSGQVCISASASPGPSTPAPPGPEATPTPTLTPPPGGSPTPPASIPASPGDANLVQLVRGCNPVVSTWPGEIEPLAVASSTDPSSAVAAIWKFDQERITWLGFSPVAPARVSDVFRIQYLDVLFVCASNGAFLTRPKA
jgi:hypothetical protein